MAPAHAEWVDDGYEVVSHSQHGTSPSQLSSGTGTFKIGTHVTASAYCLGAAESLSVYITYTFKQKYHYEGCDPSSSFTVSGSGEIWGNAQMYADGSYARSRAKGPGWNTFRKVSGGDDPSTYDVSPSGNISVSASDSDCTLASFLFSVSAAAGGPGGVDDVNADSEYNISRPT